MTSSPLISAIPPHLQGLGGQYRTTTPPTQTSPYGSYSQPTNGQDSTYTSTPPNMNNNNHEYGGYAGQYQQQQQQQQQPSAYPGYPPTYSGQTATPAPSSKLTDALASIPDDQKVRINVFRGLVNLKLQVVCSYSPPLPPLHSVRLSSCVCCL